jgi:hypothetical protein
VTGSLRIRRRDVAVSVNEPEQFQGGNYGMRHFIVVLCALLTAATPAWAETVGVKYGEQVNLETFECHDTVSSFVNKVCYQSDARYVVVLLKATYYHYCEVDPLTVDNWLAAESKGRFYNANIRGRFDCRDAVVPQFP